MDSQRNFLIITILIISFIIWQTWETEHNSKLIIKSEDTIYNKTKNNKQNYTLNNTLNKIITVKSDVLLLKINTQGGDINDAYLITYLEQLKSQEPLHLLETSKEFIYQTNSGFTVHKESLNNNKSNVTIQTPIYKTSKNQNNFVLQDNQNEMQIPLYYVDAHGILHTKTYTIKKGKFSIKIDYCIDNKTEQKIEVILFAQINQSYDRPNTQNTNNSFIFSNYRGAAFYAAKEKYKKYTLNNIKNNNLNIFTTVGWIAMMDQYFITAWFPTNKENNYYIYTNNANNNQAIIGFKSPIITIYPKKQKNIETILWVGPKIQDKMAKIAPNLELTVDYGWLWFISQPMFKLLQYIYNYIGNWGFAIVLITIIIRTIMYPLTKIQYTSIAKMRLLQPKLTNLKEKFQDNKQRFHKEIINLYKKEGVNPLGGCLPIIIQMPIFLALYYMLSNSVELRHAKFILWINDLSSQDPYYILPIIMGITMFFIQKTSPNTTQDITQTKIMNYMLIIFTIFFLWFPSGLVLYYIISNLITIIQQQTICNNFKKYK